MVSGRVLPCNNDSVFGQGGNQTGGHRNEVVAREEHKGVTLLFCFLFLLFFFFFYLSFCDTHLIDISVLHPNRQPTSKPSGEGMGRQNIDPARVELFSDGNGEIVWRARFFPRLGVPLPWEG